MTTSEPVYVERVARLIEQVSAYIEQYHGGSVEFVGLQGDVVQVRMGGACEGCALAPATLHGWVEGTLHQFFPDLKLQQV
ncbi:MAG: hypothetical protein OHK0052_20000 [Anaerolineales bacterium]